MHELLKFLNRHKTKVVGFLTVVIGFIQTQATLVQPFMSPAGYAWFVMGTGALVMGFGFLNSSSKSKPGDDNADEE